MKDKQWVQIEAGSFRSGERQLHFPNLEIGEGELIALVGRNGSGKSIFLRHLMGWKKVVSGKIESVLWSQPHSIEWVTNTRETFADLWLEDVVQLGASKSDPARLHSILKRFQLDTMKEQSIQTLSDGEWMRVRMARLFYHQPLLILMDEPTAHLDFEYRLWWEGWIKELIQLGCTIVCASHDLDWAAAAAAKVWVIDHSEIKEWKPPHFHPDVLIKKDK